MNSFNLFDNIEACSFYPQARTESKFKVCEFSKGKLLIFGNLSENIFEL